jgi:hypothetical protein
MPGRVELTVVAAQFSDSAALDRATSQATALIQAKFPQRGLCITGNNTERCLSLMLQVDQDTPDAWLPQLAILLHAVGGPVESVVVGRFPDSDDA